MKSIQLNESHNKFLIKLRDSGVVNMLEAQPCLQNEFNIKRHEATIILKKWIKTFDNVKPHTISLEEILNHMENNHV